MTAFLVRVEAKRAIVASDTAAYSPGGAPMGFMSKTLSLPAMRSILFSRGQVAITLASYFEAIGSPELHSIEGLAERLPGILRRATKDYCKGHDIVDHSGTALLEVAAVGYSEADKRMRVAQFFNYTAEAFAAQWVDESGWLKFPPVPGFDTAQHAHKREDRVAIAYLEAAREYYLNNPLMPAMIGGEVVLTELGPQSISTRVVHRFPDFDEMRHAGAAVTARMRRGYSRDVVVRELFKIEPEPDRKTA